MISEEKVKGNKILIADDNRINILYLKTFLQKQGFKVAEASSGRKALEILMEQHIDLVLLDISMPDLDGQETLSLMRGQSEKIQNSEVPVIAITAFTLDGDREKFLKQGFDEYIKKPFKKQDIISKIHYFLEDN
jgi:CheY-like chemotaxis protein